MRARLCDNVEWITADLSGSFPLLLGRTSDLETGLPSVCARADLVVSANLRSQLPIRSVVRLERSSRPISPWYPADGGAFGRAIVSRHLAALAGLETRVCLITDVDVTEEYRAGQVLERLDLLYGVRLGEPNQAWVWELAPFGEIGRRRFLLHGVVAYPIWRL